ADRETILARLRVIGGQQFNREMRQSARAIDEVGDEAEQTTKQLGALGAASGGAAAAMGLWQDKQGRWREENGRFASSARKAAAGIEEEAKATDRLDRSRRRLKKGDTRINIGPFSTSLRGGTLAVGALALAVEDLTGPALGLAEALGTTALAGGAAAGVGLLAYGQAAGTAMLATHGLTEALEGDADAFFALTPAAQRFVMQLERMRPLLDDLRADAASSMLPGVGRGIEQAARNAPVARRLTRRTGGALGAIAEQAGTMLGSQEWGRDLERVGNTNVRIIGNLGAAGLHLADALRHVAVEAAPLAEWLSRMARRGAALTETWAENTRRSGEMSRFFRDAREDLELLASIGGHTGRGIINLFGADDVDGTRTLARVDEITARFERWSRSPAVAAGLGDALSEELDDFAAGAIDMFVETTAKAAPRAAEIFWGTFVEASPIGKLLIGAWAGKKLLGVGLGTRFNPMWVRFAGGVPGSPGEELDRDKRKPRRTPPIAPAPIGKPGGSPLDWINRAKPWAKAGGAASAFVWAANEAGEFVDEELLNRGASMLQRASGDIGFKAGVNSLAGILRDAIEDAPARRERDRLERLPELTQEINLHIDGKRVTGVVTRDVLNTAARKGISPGVGGQSVGVRGKRGF
ncbi:MAG TPA: hypothetical protein VN213_13040, partial [Solirubrobacteraceae bacterium]|nr:hypothetical protein [Solirubrobacteraceae bacterium]